MKNNPKRLWMGLANNLYDKPHVGIIGVPYDGSVSQDSGARLAPAYLRKFSAYLEPIAENGMLFDNLRVMDYGDISVNNDEPVAVQQAVYSRISAIVKEGIIPAVIGGDHSISSAVVQAFEHKPDLGIIWFDSHPDLMDVYQGVNGRQKSKFSHACPLRRILELPNVNRGNVILVGIRDFILEELDYINRMGLEVLSARQLHRMTPEETASRLIEKFKVVSDIYISFDIDVLDPAFAPGTGCPVPGGLSSRYLLDIIYELIEIQRKEIFEKKLNVVGFDIVEVAPPLDGGRITCYSALGILKAMLAYMTFQFGFDNLRGDTQ